MQQIDAIPGPRLYLFRVIFSPDGKTLAVTGGEASDDVFWRGVVYLWNVASLTKIDEISMRHGGVVTASFSPDSRMLAYVAPDSLYSDKVHLWDITEEKEKPGFVQSFHSVEGVSFSPDGKTLATGYNNGVRLWDVATRTPIITYREGFSSRGGLIIFSPDGRTLVTFAEGSKRTVLVERTGIG